MKRYLIIGAICAGVVALIVWMAMHMSFSETTVQTPLKGEAAHNPYYAAIKLSETLGARAAWERVFTVPAENSVIMLSTWNWTLSRSRRERIERWVEAGGRLVVDETLIGDLDGFEKWSGIGKRDAVEKSKDAAAADDGDSTEEPPEIFDNLMPKDCETLIEDGSHAELSVCGIGSRHSLTTTRKVQWALRDGDKIEVIRTKVGLGSVTMINAAPFRRRDFFLGNHPQLFVSATQLHRGDSLLFLTEEVHASLLTLVWRFGAPVVLLMLAAIALALWRTTARFGPPTAPTETARRSLAEQIRGTGQFALRHGSGSSLHAASIRALDEAAQRRVPTYAVLSPIERAAALSRLTGFDLDALAAAVQHVGRRRSHELRNTIALLEAARRRTLIERKRFSNGTQ